MRLLMRVLLLISVVLLLSMVGVIGYFMQDPRVLLEQLETYIEDTHQLDLQINSVNISSWHQLPQLSVDLENVSIRHPEDPFSILHFDTVGLVFQALDYWDFALRLDSLSLEGGRAQVQASSSLINAIQDVVHANKKDAAREPLLDFTIAPNLLFTAEQLALLYRDSLRAKHMEGTVNTLHVNFLPSDLSLNAQVDADLAIERLTFNAEKGSYLEEARLRMQPHVRYESGCLMLPDFELWLDEACFSASAELDVGGTGHFLFDLRNETTPFATTIAFVPAILRKKLMPYTITKPLSTQIWVTGGFAAGDNPLARIDFHTTDNRFGLKGYPQLEEVSASGYLINRATQDTTNWALEHPLNLRLHFDQLSATYAGVELDFPQLEVGSTPEIPIHLVGSLTAKGKLPALNDFLPSSDWQIAGGDFLLSTAFTGPIENEKDIIRNLKFTTLELAAVRLKNAELNAGDIVVNRASLALETDTLHLRNGLITLPGGAQKIALNGFWLNNWPWQNRSERQPEGFLSGYSSYLSTAALSGMLPAFAAAGTERSSIHSLAQQIRQEFNPRVELHIDSLQLQRDLVEALVLKTSLNDRAELQLEQLRGLIEGNELKCSGAIDVAPQQPYWNLVVRSQGAANWFNRLFDNNTFFFEGGAYNFAGKVSGSIEHWSDLPRHVKGRLDLWDGDVLLGPTAVHLPIAELQVDYSGEHLRLDALKVPLSSGQSIEMTGEVRHFRSLISPEGDANDVSSSVQVKASRLGFEDLQRIFSSMQQFTEGRPTAVQQALKPSIQALYQKFHPCLTFQLDTFQFQQFISTDNLAQLGFLDENRLTFNNTGFEFKGRPVQLSAVVDIEDAAETPFEVTVETERFDLGALVETFDYFGLTSLQRAERVAGKVSLKADLQGKIIDSVGLQKDKLLGRIHFNLHEAELVNFAPIQEVANKFFRTERLHKIRFAPITDTLLITHRVVHIPRMEIQSTAFNLFVEGHLNYDNNTNIWVSLPWQNLRSWQEGELPAKRGYAESGGKLFVEISDQDGEMKYKFRFTNKRLYKHRGISDQYRIDKREERTTRRAWRKERRRAKRAGA